MKKLISILLAILTVFTIGTLGASAAPSASVTGNEAQALVEKVVDLTKTSVLFDYDNGVIYNIKPGTQSLDNYLFTKDLYTYECNHVGTGHTVDFYFRDQYLGSLVIVVYGDINGDTWCTEKDYETIKGLASGYITKGEVGKAEYIAADCNRDNVHSGLDTNIAAEACQLAKTINSSSASSNEYGKAMSRYNEILNQGKIVVEEEKPAQKGPSLLERFIAALNKILAFFGLHIEL